MRYVLEGSVQRSGQQVRINAQLIDAETDAHLWAERFESDIGIYFLTDWLVMNWDRAVIKGLGLDRFPWLKETYFGNISRILFVRQHPDHEREAKALEIGEWMERPLEIHDLGIEPLDDLLSPLMEESDDVRA